MTRRVLAGAVAVMVIGRFVAAELWRLLKDWSMPDEAFIGCWTNETIERL